MSELNSKEDDTRGIIAHVKQIQLACISYHNCAKDFQTDLLVTSFSNLSVTLSKKPKLFKALANNDWCKILTDLFKTLPERNDWELFTKVSSYIINFTDKSELLCESLIEAGMSDILVDTFMKIHDGKGARESTQPFLVIIINIVHNIARHVQLQQCFLQHPKIENFKSLILPLCFEAKDDLSIVANLVLIWLAKEDEHGMKMIEEHAGIIKKIFLYIQRTFFSKEKPITAWSLWELLDGLQALSSINSNKSQMLLLEDFVSSLIKITSSSLSSEKEVELSLGILWNLSFLEDSQRILIDEYNIKSVVEPLVRHEVRSIRNNAKGIMWNLRSQLLQCLSNKHVKYDIFLSYSHAQKDLVTKIFKRLKRDFTVWIDADNIKGSSLDDMASGIERSRIFLMCVSNAYKQSQFCHSEANYAYRNKKPIVPLIMEHKYRPDGWLGIITSSEFYIDVSDASKLTDSMTRLTSAIKYKSEPLTKGTNTDKRSNNVKEWDQEQVSCWLTDNELSGKLKGFDGEMIDALIDMKLECPQFYYDCLDRKIQLTFTDILKLNAALANVAS